jgi:alanine dehydrogenase
MQIAIPKEIKNHEYRIALPPAGARELVARGHPVTVRVGADDGAGFSDAEYAAAGARLEADVAKVWVAPR